jgi:glutaconate CoA-transferase subunit B
MTRLTSSYTPTEIMTVAAARALRNDDVCFVGIGAPSAACNLARLTHAPGITLIYESGTIDTKPDVLPLSIGDGELCDTALTTVSVPEMFRYWLQGGRITVGFLGGAQIDRYANLNTTIVGGSYAKPKVRLPGGGGAPEIATNCGEIFITMAMSPRAFVETLPFVTSFGHGSGAGSREALGVATKGPTKVITDLCVLAPDQSSRELTVVSLHPGVSAEAVQGQCAWKLRFANDIGETPPPTSEELAVLRELQARTARAHGGDA